MRPARRASLDKELELHQFCSNISQNISYISLYLPFAPQLRSKWEQKWLMPHLTPNLQPRVKLVYKCGIKNVPSLPISLPFFLHICLEQICSKSTFFWSSVRFFIFSTWQITMTFYGCCFTSRIQNKKSSWHHTCINILN